MIKISARRGGFQRSASSGAPHEEYDIEYVRSILVARLLRSPWHEGPPPRAFWEEPCEALLSLVVHRFACRAGATSFGSVSMSFC